MQNTGRARALQRATWITVAVNAALGTAKISVGVLSGSGAVLSDGIHSFSDVLTTVAVMFGLRFSGQAADRNHPYGHQRLESLVSLFLSFVLAVTAVMLGLGGVRALIAGNVALSPSVPALCVTAASIASKEWMFRYTRGVAKRYNSTSLLSDAWHHRSDALSSVAALIGVGGVFIGWPVLEPLATVAVCLIILKAAWDIGMAAANQLIDRAADQETNRRIHELALSVEGVRGVDDLRTRISNDVIFADIEVVVDAGLSVGQGHRIAEQVHDLIENSGIPMGHCMVHVHPNAEAGDRKVEGSQE